MKISSDCLCETQNRLTDFRKKKSKNCFPMSVIFGLIFVSFSKNETSGSALKIISNFVGLFSSVHSITDKNIL